jgi:hypothetical protein
MREAKRAQRFRLKAELQCGERTSRLEENGSGPLPLLGRESLVWHHVRWARMIELKIETTLDYFALNAAAAGGRSRFISDSR